MHIHAIPARAVVGTTCPLHYFSLWRRSCMFLCDAPRDFALLCRHYPRCALGVYFHPIIFSKQFCIHGGHKPIIWMPRGIHSERNEHHGSRTKGQDASTTEKTCTLLSFVRKCTVKQFSPQIMYPLKLTQFLPFKFDAKIASTENQLCWLFVPNSGTINGSRILQRVTRIHMRTPFSST